MIKNNSILVLIIFFLISTIKLMSQSPATVDEIENIKQAVLKDDVNSLNILLKDAGFMVTKSNFNYNRSGEYIISEIECHKLITRLKSGDFSGENSENLTILFTEGDDYKRLNLDISCSISIDNKFIPFYFNWRNQKWTYVEMGDMETQRYYTEDKDQNRYGFILGKNIAVRYGETSQQRQVISDSIRMEIYQKGWKSYPQFKQMLFQNTNTELGTKRNYYCSLWADITGMVYDNVSINDTPYYFHATMEEIFPKFAQKQKLSLGPTFIKIPLVKNGKTFFVSIFIGGIKKMYILDSGASDVTIDELTYQNLVRSGTLKVRHRLPNGEYKIADGSTKNYQRTLIPEVSINGIIVKDVEANVVPEGQPLLLGKSFLDNFRTWKIDNFTNTLILEVE